MKYKAILFDMDGTVLDTLADLHSAVNACLSQFGLPEIAYTDTRRFVGNGARRLIEQAVPAGTPTETTDAVLQAYIPYYDAHSNEKTEPYAGILECLHTLKNAGIRLAVVSNKPDITVQGLSDIYFKDMFEKKMGENEKAGLRRKPFPDMPLAAIADMGLDKADCVYIGDSEVDLATAHAAGLDCITVTWGFRDRDVLEAAGAVCFADTPAELTELLLKE